MPTKAHFAVSNRGEKVVNAATRDGDLRDNVQFISWFVDSSKCRQSVKTCLRSSERNGQMTMGRFSLPYRTEQLTDGYFRLTLSHFDALAVKIWTPLPRHDGFPVLRPCPQCFVQTIQ